MVEYPVLVVNRDYHTAAVTCTVTITVLTLESVEWCVKVSRSNQIIDTCYNYLLDIFSAIPLHFWKCTTGKW